MSRDKSAGQSRGAWSELCETAREAARSAYCPYSGLGVGAAAAVVADDGSERIVSGCNVENASYGLTLCAECSVVSAAVSSGGGRLARVAVCDADGTPLSPCGRCRQLLYEHGGPELLVYFSDGPLPLDKLLPGAFGRGDLP